MQKVNVELINQERIHALDMMRGLAILGIFLVNMISFHSPSLNIDPLTWWDDSLSKAASVFIDIFAQASFYPLFSLLFGYGLVILFERSEKKQLNFYLIAARRLFFLLAIGMIHAFFVWYGDILIIYAVLGFFALLFLKLPGRALLVTGLLIYLLPNLLLTLMLFIGTLFAPQEEFSLYDQQAAESSIEVYSEGSFWEITVQRANDWYEVNNPDTFPILLIWILPLFLIGAGAAKLRWLENPDAHRKKILTIMFFTLGFGLLLKMVPYIIGKNSVIDYIQDVFGGPLLSIAYAFIIVILAKKQLAVPIFAPLAAVGKMSLSNYLFQSLFSTFIYYSYGLGFYGEITLFTGTMLVFAIFAFQVVFSHYWMKHFYYGPFEWLWRSFTYLTFPKWKRR